MNISNIMLAKSRGERDGFWAGIEREWVDWVRIKNTLSISVNGTMLRKRDNFKQTTGILICSLNMLKSGEV
ncbi:hypothetical protein EK904_009041 [Melospiza melodia maxima]|nr:hypothetical protein EK904_009041 [Melospiza melodia maxima]